MSKPRHVVTLTEFGGLKIYDSSGNTLLFQVPPEDLDHGTLQYLALQALVVLDATKPDKQE